MIKNFHYFKHFMLFSDLMIDQYFALKLFLLFWQNFHCYFVHFDMHFKFSFVLTPIIQIIPFFHISSYHPIQFFIHTNLFHFSLLVNIFPHLSNLMDFLLLKVFLESLAFLYLIFLIIFNFVPFMTFLVLYHSIPQHVSNLQVNHHHRTR